MPEQRTRKRLLQNLPVSPACRIITGISIVEYDAGQI